MSKARRSYTNDYKVAAVKLVTEKGLSCAEAGRRLGINPNSIHRWKAQYEARGNDAFPGQGKLSPLEEELHKLRAENRRLLMEKEILKKAAAFFAKEQP
jgi:transposase